MDPRVTTVRFFLACVALAIVSFISPEWCLVLVGTGFGWWTGCGCCATGCDGSCTGGICNSDQASKTFSVTITGMANNTCINCSDFNLTYSGIPQFSNCDWEISTITGGSPPGSCSLSASLNRLGVFIQSSGGNTIIIGELFINNPTLNEGHFIIGTLGASSTNCCVGTIGPTAMSFITNPPLGVPACDSSGATMTIVGSDH